MDTDREPRSLWLFITALCVGGAEQTLVDLANNLDRRGYQVTVWTIFETAPLASELNESVDFRSLTPHGRVENGSVRAVTNPIAYLTVPLQFCYVAATEQPDVIQSFLFFDNVLGRLAGLFSPTTVVTGVRAVPNDPHRTRAIVDRLTMGLSDHVVSNSDAGRELAIERGADPEDVSVIRNGRHLDTYAGAEPGPVTEELAIDDGELVVGTVGRLLERKGHFELISAWASVRERDIDARLVFVGDGEDRQELVSHAQELGCADSVEFLGTRRDVPALLAAFDVFAFPSYFEGLPGALIEAMAAGLPIVATPVDGNGELLDSYRTGLFVPPEGATELSWALTRLLESPALRDSLGEAAQERARTAFAVERMIEQFDDLHRELAAA